MKLEFPKIPIETSENFETKNFGFGDGRVLMIILRSKMYSDPISAVCQEIASNSRDANREVGKENRPIKVKMPNRFDETISFIDEGPGISPDRMDNIFILYGNSTKRGDNIQTGGFGLGAKTPFAYTDTFTILTITEKNGKRTRRQYVAFIDDSQLGALSLLPGVVETDEPTGTTISMAVKSDDIDKFKAAIRKVGNYWKVQPIIEGAGTWKWDTHEYLYENEDGDWSLERGHGEPLIIIDGINYRLNKKLIDPNHDGYRYNRDGNNNLVLLNYPARLFFSTGELAVTANREDLDYQPDVISKIKARLIEAYEELKIEAESSIKDADNLWEASLLWNGGFSTFKSFIPNPSWNGKDLVDTITVPYNQEDSIKIMLFEYDKYNHSVAQVKQYRRFVRRVGVNNTTLLVEHDEVGTRPSRLRLMTLFDNNPMVNQIGVVEFTKPEGRVHFQKHYNWNDLNATMLSTIVKKILPPAVRAARKRRPVSKVKDMTRRDGRGGYVYEWSPSQTQLDDKDGGVYVIIKDAKPLVNGKVIDKSHIWRIKNILDIEILGIQYKYRNKIGPQWETLTSYSANEIVELAKDPEVLEFIQYGTDNSMEVHLNSYYNELVKLDSEIVKRDGVFAKYMEMSKKGKKGEPKAERLQELQRALGMPVTVTLNELKNLQDACDKTYPLVSAMKEHYWYSNLQKDKVAREMIFYINAKDKV